MSHQNNILLTAAAFLFLLGISVARSADAAADATFPNSGPKPLIVDWRSVESGDYQSYIKNLQDMGCPQRTIQSIITADVMAAFAGKRAAAVAACYQNFKYWKTDPTETEAHAKLATQRRAINEEMNVALQQLLGTDMDLPDTSRDWKQEELQQELYFLTPEKLKATQLVLMEYEKIDRQMKELAGGLNLTDDTNELQQILKRYQEEQSTLQQVISPTEYQQVEMTTSWTAENLRHALVHFEPTEQEFRIIFDAWQPHDVNLSTIYATRQSDPGNNEVYAKIKAQLSAPRYEQYCASWWK